MLEVIGPHLCDGPKYLVHFMMIAQVAIIMWLGFLALLKIPEQLNHEVP